VGGARDLDDRKRRRVAGEDGVLGNDLVQLAEQLHLLGEALDDRLDDDVAVAQFVEVGAEAQAAADRVDVVVTELATLATALQGLLHAMATGCQCVVVGLCDARAQAAASTDLGDA
jgi:hypothetical protein